MTRQEARSSQRMVGHYGQRNTPGSPMLQEVLLERVSSDRGRSESFSWALMEAAQHPGVCGEQLTEVAHGSISMVAHYPTRILFVHLRLEHKLTARYMPELRPQLRQARVSLSIRGR